MAYYRSHFVGRGGYAEMEASLRVWRTKYSAATPGYRGVLLVHDLDDDARRYVTLECTSAEGFDAGGCDEVGAFTKRVRKAIEVPIRYLDTGDVQTHASADSGEEEAPAGSVFRSHFFWAQTPSEVEARVAAWQDEAQELSGYVRSWLVRGIAEPKLHGLSTGWTGEPEMRGAGARSLDALFESMENDLLTDVQIAHVRSAGELS